ncbi:MAG: hypothetical protein G01um101429_18 [Parcubacteria group bacterium Gr01-1014_29]|nr:MAG: hypothetical protein G01um101429_18 [Parcubacteria group bacterium Gr01-1014_29]
MSIPPEAGYLITNMFQIITKLKENSKEWWGRNADFAFLGMSIFLIVVLGFGVLRLGFILQDHTPVEFTDTSSSFGDEFLYEEYMNASGFPGLVAASRNGKRYYYPWCGGLSRIKEANRIWFDSEKAAQSAGYTIASGCDGL